MDWTASPHWLGVLASMTLVGGLRAQTDPCTLQQQVLVPPNPQTDRYESIGDIDGDTLVVQSITADGWHGAVFVLVRQAGTWTLQQKVSPPDGALHDYFGQAVAVDGDTLAVGSNSDTGPGVYSGSVYVFERAGSSWSLQQKFTGSGVGEYDHFGCAVALEGDTLVVGCRVENQPAGWGTAYVFERQAGSWVETFKLVPDTFPSTDYGSSADLRSDRIAIGSPAPHSITDVGKVYVYERAPGGWSKTALLEADDSTYGDAFGRSVSLDDDRLLVGADQADPFGLNAAGSAYVFARNGSSWTQLSRLLPNPIRAEGRFGHNLQIAGDWALVASEGKSLGGNYRAVDLFHRSESGWRQQLRIGDRSKARLDGETFGLSGSENSIGIHELPPGPLATYCTAKISSNGCVPRIDFLGVPSLSTACAFWITAHEIVNAKVGLLFYSPRGPATLPFAGGLLCVQPPVFRTSAQFSGGNPPPADDCSGSFAFDFSAWMASPCWTPVPAGDELCAQYWYRDPNSLGGAGLSDALRFTLWP